MGWRRSISEGSGQHSKTFCLHDKTTKMVPFVRLQIIAKPLWTALTLSNRLDLFGFFAYLCL
jgi:hypothetical protein